MSSKIEMNKIICSRDMGLCDGQQINCDHFSTVYVLSKSLYGLIQSLQVVQQELIETLLIEELIVESFEEISFFNQVDFGKSFCYLGTS